MCVWSQHGAQHGNNLGGKQPPEVDPYTLKADDERKGVEREGAITFAMEDIVLEGFLFGVAQDGPHQHRAAASLGVMARQEVGTMKEH